MPQFVAFIQERKSGPFLSRTFVGRSATEITARLLDSGTAVATVFEPDSIGALAHKPIPLRQVLFFMEQMESALFLNMEPHLALRVAGLTISEKSRSGRHLRAVIEEMGHAVARGESLSNVARQYPNLFNDVAVGLVAAGEGSGSLDQSFRSIRELVARTDNLKHQTRMMLLQPAMTLLVAFATVAVLVAY
ncbi:MAG: type II secretion system F family protein, partial [Verrucomicrobia bacterium]|nr:type II secretion system F family protein [Verrucomicrobiota bacterium]